MLRCGRNHAVHFSNKDIHRHIKQIPVWEISMCAKSMKYDYIVLTTVMVNFRFRTLTLKEVTDNVSNLMNQQLSVDDCP